ncbi:hypothetical protein HMI51_44360 [Corallococcus coralloides]|nr:hypothetical protein [Corallococcus coralloides]
MHRVIARPSNNREKPLEALEQQRELSRKLCKNVSATGQQNDFLVIGPQRSLSAEKPKPQRFECKADRLEAFGVSQRSVASRAKAVSVEETFNRLKNVQ